MERLKSPSRSRARSFSAEAERRYRSFLRGFGVKDEAAMKELVRRLGRLAPAAAPTQIDAAAGLWFADLLGQPESDAARALFAEAPPVALVEVLRRGLPALPPPILGGAMPEAALSPQRLRPFPAKPLRARTA
jgi:hypothetical protein